MPYDKAALRRELSRDEGRRDKPYFDSKGIKTVGVGWNLEANGIPQDVLPLLGLEPDSHDRMAPYSVDYVWPDPAIDALLDLGIARAEGVLNDLLANWHSYCDVTVPLGSAGDVRTRALLNLAFNMGKGHVDAAGVKHGLMSFEHFLAAVDGGQWAAAATHLRGSAWERDVGPGRSGRIERMLESGETVA